MSRYANKFAQAKRAAKSLHRADDRPLVDRLVEALQDEDDRPRRAVKRAARASRKVAK